MSLLKEDNGSTMIDNHCFKLLGCFDCRGQFHHSKILWPEGGGDRNLISMGAEAEQSRCRISMGAYAAEFQWEPSFVEQKQQACLFSFSVGDVAKEAHVSCKRVDRACLLCKASRSSYIELFCVSVH